MAALDFPASPTVGQKYPSPAVTGVPVYSWDGEKWTTLGGAIGSTGASDAIPLIDAGTGAAGSSTLWSRGDHAHPPITTSLTPPPGDNDTSIATTAFVSNAVSTAVGGIPGAPSAVVRYDIAQTLTAPQLIQARQNIYAAPFDAMAYSGLQINGGMEVSQENGATGRSTVGYICDGWSVAFGSGAINAAVSLTTSAVPGFSSYLAVGITTGVPSLAAGDVTYVYQMIEGYRIARLAWGTANAMPLTISFWSKHHRVGTYSVALRNKTGTRSYAATYTHNAADTVQYNVINIPGDTAGTWATDNTTGIILGFVLGCGTTYTAPSPNSWIAGNYMSAPGQVNAVAATSDAFIITGVTILPGNEAPSAARSPFVMRPYPQELITCKRYWQKLGGSAPAEIFVRSAFCAAHVHTISYPVEMRALPTAAIVGAWTLVNAATPALNGIGNKSLGLNVSVPGAGDSYIYNSDTTCYISLDARL